MKGRNAWSWAAVIVVGSRAIFVEINWISDISNTHENACNQPVNR
jgi:hypothetical protein